MNFSEVASPAVISSVVAVGSLILSFFKLFKENDANAKKIKRIMDLSEVYGRLEDGSSAKHNIQDILDIETGRFKDILTRKLNYSNVAVVIVVAIVGGGLSYVSLLLANNSYIILSVLGWIAFAVVAFFTLGISITGLASIYNNENDKKEKK
jgi:hypothetical protein